MKDIPVYRYSIEEAKINDEMDRWKESYRENCDCARSIEKMLRLNSSNVETLESAVDNIVHEYGLERVFYVLANTLKENSHNKEFSDETKMWISSMSTCIETDDTTWLFSIDCESSEVDRFVKTLKQIWDEKELFNQHHCLSERDGEIDYTGKVVVISPHVLKDEYKTPENQLFLARCGFGCKPDSLGRKVFGEFLVDGEETYYLRSELLGVIKDEFLPEWAANRLEEIKNQSEENNMEMEGN